ncbi:hypothetical protein BU14_0721s0010 [Porphyra umbilicalis]|uniref:Elongation factor EFG domain-containing protein n=1 Tax=Porphyra umbilicalis TaxID=2786 RepID=A0A1X6NPL4_PORUM|nr:hypothetical protein BU14_0721s0010 [Porphyra umbilicalis]|eukprot:OSX70558.1 hypothetical protein BU14_0721s0010 [Porphyra umbilicalis]
MPPSKCTRRAPTRWHKPRGAALAAPSPTWPPTPPPVAGIVYGLSLHAYSGRLTEVLVVSGTLTKHAKLVLNTAAGGGGAATGGGAGGGGRVSPARLLRRRPGGALEEVASAGPGELVCLEKIDGAAYGDTLTCAERSALQLRPLPRPYGRCTFTLPVGDDARADDKLLRALGRVAEEDPSLRLSRNEETGELLLSGTGLLHLGIVRERLAAEAKIDLPLATPHVAYHETLTGRPVRAPGRLVKQSGGSGQYAVVEVEVTPLPRGAGFVWADTTKGGIVTKSFSAAAGRGAAEALKAGPLGGFPLTDVSVSLIDGKMHSVDSSENAFFHATASAVRAAASAAADKGHAALLEPIMHLAVTVDEAHMGRISKDLATRRGRLSGFRPASEDLGLVVVEASVPLAELLTYSKTLDALTSGTGSFTMAVERYEEVTSHAAAAVLGTRRGGAAVDAKAAGGKGGGEAQALSCAWPGAARNGGREGAAATRYGGERRRRRGDDGGVDAADRAGTPSPVESSPPAAAGSEKATVADVNAESPLLGFVALAAAMRGALPPIDGEADEPPVLLAPDGVDMGALAEAYGAALGQALVTSGLGLDVQAVVSGMLSAAACDDSPMSVEMYEHQMNLLTAANVQANAAFNRSEADRFFSEAQDDHSIVALHPGRLLMEAEEPHPDDGVGDSPPPPAADAEKDAPPVGTPPGVRGGDEGGAPLRRRSRPPPRRSASAGATAVVLLQGRLLDGRLFYTPPPAPPAAPPSTGGEAPPPPPRRPPRWSSPWR